MKPRIYYTESQKALMWERWKQGDSLQTIAQLFDQNHSSIQRILAESGGIRPRQRRRAVLALTLAEREDISRSVVTGNQSARSRRVSDAHHRLSAGKSNATAAAKPIVRSRRISVLGFRRVAPNVVSWPRTATWPTWSPTSCN